MSTNPQQPAQDESQKGIDDEVQHLFDTARQEVLQHRADRARRDELQQNEEIDSEALAIAAARLIDLHKQASQSRAKELEELEARITGYQQRLQGGENQQAPRHLASAPADQPPLPSETPQAPTTTSLDLQLKLTEYLAPVAIAALEHKDPRMLKLKDEMTRQHPLSDFNAMVKVAGFNDEDDLRKELNLQSEKTADNPSSQEDASKAPAKDKPSGWFRGIKHSLENHLNS